MCHLGIPQDHLPKWYHLLSSDDHQKLKVKSLLIQIMNMKWSISLMMMKRMQIQLFNLSQQKGKKGVSKTPKKSAPKIQEKHAPKKATKKIVPKVKLKKSSRYVPPVLEKFNTFYDAKSKSN